jgi:hypothetical protein
MEIAIYLGIALTIATVIYAFGHWVVTSGSPWVPVLGRVFGLTFGGCIAGLAVTLIGYGTNGSMVHGGSVFFGTLIAVVAWRILRRFK